MSDIDIRLVERPISSIAARQWEEGERVDELTDTLPEFLEAID